MTAFVDGIATGEAIAAGQLTATEAVEAAIARCEDRNGPLNAVIHTNYDRATDRAEIASRARSPLAGVPMLTKDLICREEGLPFHEGSRFLKELGWTGGSDQDLAVRFRDAGLVSIGRTNAPEFGMQPSTEPLAYGPTHNPWCPGHSPGGSSGGSAAAVAAGIVPIAHGNDVGGSLRNPASMCGVFGLKPSRGRSRMTPDFGDAMLGLAEEHVITRTVRDSAAALDAISRSWLDDVYHHPLPAPGWLDSLQDPPDPLRIGWHVPTGVPVDPAVAGVLESTAALLAELGHDVVASAPPAMAEDVSPMALPHYTAGTAWMVDHHWPRVTGVDAIPEELLEPTTLLLAEMGRGVSAGALLEARELGQQWTRRFVSWWLDDGFDLLLTPTIATLPPRHGETDDGLLVALAAPFNLSGLPAASVPAAVHDGLPIGVQLAAPMFREDLIFGVAQQLETATGWLDWYPHGRP